MPPVKPARQSEADQVERLIAAIHDQTAAMRELAESNRQVVDLVIAQQGDDEGEGPSADTYLDGTPKGD